MRGENYYDSGKSSCLKQSKQIKSMPAEQVEQSIESLDVEQAKEEYKDYLTTLPMDIETVIQFIGKIWFKEGILAIEGYGRLVLQGTYLDFWNWIYEDREYQKDEMLIQIACYAENNEVRANKQKLFEALKKYDEYAVAELVQPLSFYSEKTELGYTQRKRIVEKKVEDERSTYLKELKKYSHSFAKFSIETESAELFLKSTKKECQAYLRQIENVDLYRAFVLYQPSQRDFETLRHIGFEAGYNRERQEYVVSREYVDAYEGYGVYVEDGKLMRDLYE